MDLNLIIDDDYIIELGETCSTRGEKLEANLQSYIKIIGEIESITEGELSKALNEYKECANHLIEPLSTISESVEKITNSFIIDVNEADDYLF